MKLLDLFCGAGGAAMGYHRAGFEIVGVDHLPQKRFPFEFVQADALEYVKEYGCKFDVIHASPPCQRYSSATPQQSKLNHPDLIRSTRELLQSTGKPFVIENVVGSPLVNPIVLCGAMFGLQTYRHRLFESNISLFAPPHPAHTTPQTKMGRPPKDGEFIQVVGHFSGVAFAQRAMDIDWMGQKGLAQAIPPAYTEWIGHQIISRMNTP